jgi:O-antigen ligase
MLRHGEPPAVSITRIRLPAILFVGVCVHAALQTIPIPVLAPASALWTLARAAGVDVVAPTVSINPVATWTALMRLVTYGLVFWLTLQCCRSPARSDHTTLMIALATAAYGTYGILVRLSEAQTILWFDKWAYVDSITATFVNRNNFATFLGLGLLCMLGHLTRQIIQESNDAQAGRMGAAPFAGGLKFGFIVSASAAICLAAALVLTQSRAGVLCSTFAIIVFLLGIALKSRRSRSFGLLGGGLVLLLFVLLLQASGEGLIDRLARLVWKDEDFIGRAHIYASSLSAIADYPWLGLGYGTFDDGFKIYRSEQTPLYYDKAHNTYLELAMGLGIPMAGALVLAATLIAVRCARGFKRRQSLFVYPWMAFCGSILVALHAFVDFSVQIPAVAVQFAAILGVGCAQSWSSRADTSKPRRNRQRASVPMTPVS